MGRVNFLNFNRSKLRIEHHRVAVQGLPSGLHGFRLAHLSDWHVRWLFVSRQELVDAVKRSSPNLIVSTGDFCDRRDDIPKAITYVNDLASCAPMVTVLGNNDHDNFPATTTRYLVRELTNAGCRVLHNESWLIRHKDAALQLVGIDDPLTNHADIDASFRQVDPRTPTVALAHSTEVLFGIHDERIDLLLTGHTHGGQIRFPWLGPIRPADYFSRRGYWEGFHRLRGIQTYIHRGLGCNLLPIRLNCPPTIAIHELVSKG